MQQICRGVYNTYQTSEEQMPGVLLIMGSFGGSIAAAVAAGIYQGCMLYRLHGSEPERFPPSAIIVAVRFGQLSPPSPTSHPLSISYAHPLRAGAALYAPMALQGRAQLLPAAQRQPQRVQGEDAAGRPTSPDLTGPHLTLPTFLT